MKILKFVPYLIGVSQLVLGAFYLFMPLGFLAMQGHTPVEADIGYPLSMLAARFFVYGIGMFYIARAPLQNMFWLYGMVAIQAIDLAGGLYYTGTGIVDIAHSGVAMFNATFFIVIMMAYSVGVKNQGGKNVAQAAG